MITVQIPAAINSVDAPTGATQNIVNVDLRQQTRSGGLINATIAAASVSAGTAALLGNVIVDQNAGNTKDATIFVDLRQQSNEGGTFEVEVQGASIVCQVAAAPIAPTTGVAVSGAQAARNETFSTTYVDANGNETLPSPTTAQAVPINDVATVASPGASTNAVKYNVYGVITGGILTLQTVAPITLGTPFQEAAGGLLTTGRVQPTNAQLVTGACTATLAAGPPLAAGAATLTITQ